jgi:hypothetical protein
VEELAQCQFVYCKFHVDGYMVKLSFYTDKPAINCLNHGMTWSGRNLPRLQRNLLPPSSICGRRKCQYLNLYLHYAYNFIPGKSRE